MTEANGWPMLWPSVVLSGLPLLLAWALDRCLKSRAAVRSLRLRAALLTSMVVALLPMLPLRVARPPWLPAPLAARTGELSEPKAAPATAPEPPNPVPVAGSQGVASRSRASDFAAPSSAAEAPAANSAVPAASVKYLSASSAPAWQSVALSMWLAGALILLGWSAWCHAYIGRVRHHSQVLVEGEAFEEAARIAEQWKMKPSRLLRTPGIASPFASGVWRTGICWPESMQAEPNSEPWRAILRHEMAHCRRRDCAWNALAQAARAVLWPQPMLWWACVALQKNSEDVCDEAALEGCAAASYARGLLDLSQRLQAQASTCSIECRTAGAGALPPQPELSRRVARILKPGARDAWRIGWRTRLVTVAALCGVVGASVLATADGAPRAQEAGAGTSIAPGAPVHVDLSTPQAALDTFVAAVKAGDARALSQCVNTANSAEDLEDFADTMRAAMLKGVSFRVSPWDIEGEGGAAVARATVAVAQIGRKHTSSATVRLRKSESGWKIQRDNALTKPGDAFAWVISGVANPEVKRLRAWAARHGRGVLRGQVLVADGSPAAGATVVLEMGQTSLRQIFTGDYYNNAYNRSTSKRMSRIVSRRVTTDAQGRYRIDGLTDATYAVSALWPATTNVEMNRDSDAQQIAFWQSVKASENTTAQAPVLRAQRTAQVDILVVDARDGTPLQGAYFSVVSALSPWMSRESGADGHVILNVPPGKVRLTMGLQDISDGHRTAMAVVTQQGNFNSERGATIQADGKPPIPYPGVTTCTVEAGQTRHVTIRLMPYVAPAPRVRLPADNVGHATLRGRVQYEDGTPAPNVVVMVRMRQEERRDIVRQAGLFNKIEELSHEPYRSRWRQVAKLIHADVLTDAQGEFRATGLISAPYDLMTGEPNWKYSLKFNPGTVGNTLSAAVPGVQARDGETISLAQPIVLTAGALIRGRITDQVSGAGIGGLTIRCSGPHRPSAMAAPAEVRSQPDGSFEMRVAPGLNEIYLTGPSSSLSSHKFRFAGTDQRTPFFVVALPRGYYSGGSLITYRFTSDADRNALRRFRSRYVEPRHGQILTLDFQLRRLRRATPQEEATAR